MLDAAISIILNTLLNNNKSLVYRGLQGLNISKNTKSTHLQESPDYIK